MSDFKTTVALEIGAQSVTMAVFVPAGKGFALSRYARRDVLLDPVEEGMRMDYVSNAIAELVDELKVRGSEVHNVVSGQQVFMRFIKLPALDMDDLAEQVGYEAQQHIPFPIEDIVYSYQELSSAEDSGEREVLLVAIKKDVLDNLNTQVESNGLSTTSVDCSITSLYNAYRVSYPGDTQSVVILDIGAKTTDIIFSDNGRFFTRSVTAAGSFITNSVAREFGLSFREAEKLKVERGQVSLGNGHTDAMSAEDASLATVIRTSMGRLSSEVQRTINHYRAQYKGNTPVKAYICGGGARMPFAQEFLQTALNMPVEFLNPLVPFSIGKKVDTAALEMDALCLGPVAGAAVTGAKFGEFNIDLVPTSVGKERAEKQLVPWVITAGVIALAGAAVFAYGAQKDAEDVEDLISSVTGEHKKLMKVQREIEDLQSDYDRDVRSIESIASLLDERFSYAKILAPLAEKTVSYKYWVKEFAPLVNYDVQAVDPQKIAQYRLLKDKPVRGTAVQRPKDSEDPELNRKDPMVTAIYLSGYTVRDPRIESSTEHQNIVRNAIAERLHATDPDSPFNFTKEQLDNNVRLYIQFELPAKDNRTASSVPDYLQRFHVVLPLKQPIPVPELAR